MNPARAFRGFRRLPSDERRLAVRALGVVAAVRLQLTLRPFPAVDRSTTRAIAQTRGPHSPARIGAVVESVSRVVPRASCLTQALAARALLAGEGYASTLRLGMARIDGRIHAHAWLETDAGVVVGAAGHEQFAVFEASASPSHR